MNYIIDLYSKVRCANACSHCLQMNTKAKDIEIRDVIQIAKNKIKDDDVIYIVCNYGDLNYSSPAYLLCYTLAKTFPNNYIYFVSPSITDDLQSVLNEVPNVMYKDCREFILQSCIPNPNGAFFVKPYEYLYQQSEVYYDV